MPIPTENVTLDQFLALPEDGYRDEVSRGRLIREPQPSDVHGAVCVNVITVLGEYLRTHSVGRLRTHSGFLLSRAPLTIRGPDVAFISNERLVQEAADHPFFHGAPDLAIEVVSPSNTASELPEKVAEYFEAGTHIVWVCYPKTQSVAVHHPSGEIRLLRAHETLTAPELLPGFEVSVAKLFDM